jgi:hypothetical protein
MKRGKLTIRREKTRPKSKLSSLNYGNGIIQMFRPSTATCFKWMN